MPVYPAELVPLGLRKQHIVVRVIIASDGRVARLEESPLPSDADPQYREALKLNASELLQLGVIDGVIPEPLGGAHHDPVQTANNLKEAIVSALRDLERISTDKLLRRRYEKFRKMGRFQE